MVITEDEDWISVLKDVCLHEMHYGLLKVTGLQDGMVFPETADLCARILEAHELQNDGGWYSFS